MVSMNALLASIVLSGLPQPPVASLVPVLIAAPTQGQAISLNFSNTDIGQVFRAIGLRTGANIVYGSADKTPVTLHLEAQSVEEAVRAAAASAGLSYRRTGRVYVVAKPEALAQALEPYTQRVKIEAPGDSEDLAKRLQTALPYAKISASGKYLLITATPEDVSTARELIADRRAELAPGSSTSKVVKLRSAPITKIAQVLADLYPSVKSTVITEDKTGGGTLTFSGNELEVEKAYAQAVAMDDASATPVSEEEYRVYEVRFAAANTLKQFMLEAAPNIQVMIAPGSQSPPSPQFKSLTGSSFLQSSGGGSAAGGSASGSSDSQESAPSTEGGVGDRSNRSRRLVLRGQRADVDQAVRLLGELDLMPSQVKVDVQVIDASPTDLSQAGFDWSWTPFQLEELVPGSNVSGNTGQAVPWENVDTRPIGFGQWSRIPFRIAAAISGLVTKRQAKLLANPSVQVIDNDDANIFIGDTIRTKLAQAGALGTQTIQVAEFNVGIVLLLRPRVNADGQITMRIHPVVSTVTGLIDGLPQTTAREAETTVMIKDGETMVIGGLIRDEEIKTMREVPILSQLPFLGELFRSRSTEKRKSNVLVMITPHIVKEPVAQAQPPLEKKP
jgi:type II secretory pathway component GspD/PulD (secretin)